MAVYLQPDNLADALTAAAAGPVAIMAGCTDLFPATEAQSLRSHRTDTLIDVTRIAALRQITTDADGLRIGAAATWAEIIAASLPAAFDALKAAARQIGSVQIQSAGTVGGNLCNASPAADGVPCLLVLDARVELASTTGTRHLPLADFLTGPRRTQARADEIMTAIIVPPAALVGRSAFVKLGTRAHLVISIVMAAARIVVRDGLIAEAALSIGACGPVATRLAAQERALIGLGPHAAHLDPDLIAPALSPIDDVRADAAYRLTAATELLSRAVTEAMA